VSRILILGGTGLAGIAIVRKLAADGHQVSAPARGRLDVLDAAAVAEAVFEWLPDVVIDCSQGADAPDDVAAARIVEAARNVASAADALDAHLIYLSCARVFDAGPGTDYAEPMPVQPQSPFGRAKVAAERAVSETCERHAIVRSSWLFGIGRANFVSDVVDQARAAARLVVAEGTRSAPTSTADLAWAIGRLVTPAQYGVHHVSSSGSCTPVQLARNVVRLAGLDCDVVPAAGEPPSVRLPEPGPALVTVRGGPVPPDWRSALADYLRELAEARTRR
jgi:dTDP-4-dehydrorhamnose reductase